MENKKAVYHITENGNGKSLWTRIGVAFVNIDGSLNVLLDSLPLNGRLHIRGNNFPEGNEIETKGELI